MRLDRYRCTALLAHGQYQLIQTEAIAGTPDEAREVARWQTEGPGRISRRYRGHRLLPIPADGRAPQMYCRPVAEATIAPLVQAFQAAKVPLAAIDLPELSQRNLAALFEQDGRGLATLVFDDDEACSPLR
jgi:MSHA biogenesis protein MshI